MRKDFALGLTIAWVLAICIGCGAGRKVSSPPATSALFQAAATPPPTVRPTPSLSATPLSGKEGKPTPSGGGQALFPFPTATLPPLQEVSWRLYELPEIGIRLRIPAEWEMLRMPGGGGIFAAGGEYRIYVAFCCEELPRTMSDLQAALGPYYRDVFHEEEVVIVPMEGPHWQGIGVWPRSNPEVCLDVYILTPEMIREISLFSVFCESGKERLVPLGQAILDSIEIFPPSGE